MSETPRQVYDQEADQMPFNQEQAQLIDPETHKEDLARQEVALQAIADIEASDPDLANTPRLSETSEDDKGKEGKPETFSIDAYRDALGIVMGGDLPQDLQLKRDWSDGASSHGEKQSQHESKLAEALANKIKALEHQKGIDEQRKLDAKRKEEHNKQIEAREQETAERQATREAHKARQRLIHGELRISKDPDLQSQLEREADEHVDRVHGPAKHENYGILDTKKLKPENTEDEEIIDAEVVEPVRADAVEATGTPASNDTDAETSDRTVRRNSDEDPTVVIRRPADAASNAVETNRGEKFDHGQSFISWARENRVPGIRKLLKERKLGKAAMASIKTMADYAGANITSGEQYDKYMDKINNADGESSVNETVHASRPAATERSRPAPYRETAPSPLLIELKGQISSFDELLKDPTYVPTVEEYKKLLATAGQIRTEHTTERKNGYFENRVTYTIGDPSSKTERVNPHTARALLDSSNGTRWELSDDVFYQIDHALKLNDDKELLRILGHNGRGQRRRQTRTDIMSFDSFSKERQKTDNAISETELADDYHEYLLRRIELQEWLDQQRQR